MATFIIKLHLEKEARTFTMEAERTEMSTCDAYLEKHPALREIGGDETEGAPNDIYIADDLEDSDIGTDIRARFLLPRKIYLVAEDENTAELLVWIAQAEAWFPIAINYAAFGGHFFERVDKTEPMFAAMILYYDHPCEFRHFSTLERRLLQRKLQRDEDPVRWKNARKREIRASITLTEKNSGRSRTFRSPEALELELERKLKAVRSEETEELSHSTEFQISCRLRKNISFPVRVFEGTEADWQAWKTAARDDWDFRMINFNKRRSRMEKLSDAYYKYMGSGLEGDTYHRLEGGNADSSIPTPEQVRGMMLGFAVGDALGVPVEFSTREERDRDPVKEMRAGGVWKQPVGTWSDDTSLTLATMESLTRLHGFMDYNDMMKNFVRWDQEAAFTATGERFDIGRATSEALLRYREKGIPPLKCGGKGEKDNGNGSLMRILPVAAYLCREHGNRLGKSDIEDVSALTHRHPCSQVACVAYSMVAAELFYGATPQKAVEQGLYKTLDCYWNLFFPAYPTDHKRVLAETLQVKYGRLWRRFMTGILPTREEIRSSGYVVDTLEAALWCLLTTKSYREAVLTAVNLGGDTDTVAAVTGGLAGICYGAGAIPQEWLATLKKREYIEELCRDFCQMFEEDFEAGWYRLYKYDPKTGWHRLPEADAPENGSRVWIEIAFDEYCGPSPDEAYSSTEYTETYILEAVFNGKEFVCEHNPFDFRDSDDEDHRGYYEMKYILAWKYARKGSD